MVYACGGAILVFQLIALQESFADSGCVNVSGGPKKLDNIANNILICPN